MASRPALVSQITPVMRPSATMARLNQECRRRLIAFSATRSLATRFQPSGSKAAAQTPARAGPHRARRPRRCSGVGLVGLFFFPLLKERGAEEKRGGRWGGGGGGLGPGRCLTGPGGDGGGGHRPRPYICRAIAP